MDQQPTFSPELLHALVQAAPVAMIMVDLHGRVQVWNPAAEQLFGWSAAEAVGRIAPHVPVEQQADFLAWLAVGRKDQQRRDIERVRKDGVRIRLRVLTAPVHDAHGSVIGVMGVHTDLAEQLLAESELEHQRRMLQTVIDTIPVMIAYFDQEGRFQLVNKEWERVMGWDAAAMNTNPSIFTDLYPDAAVREEVRRYIQAATADWREFTIRTRSGAALQIAWANVRMPDGSQFSFGQDVTALRNQADALQHQLDLMHLLLESIPFGYIYAEAPSGKILHFNSQAAHIVGHPIIPVATVDEYANHGAHHPDGRPYTPADYPIAQVLHSGEPAPALEMRYLRGDGRWIILRNTALPVRNSQGAMIGVINLFEDITEHQQLEERFLQAQKLESIGRLAGGIAHDFNNLLVPIIGYVDLGMHALPADSALYADLQQVRYAAERAADLTRQILAFSRRQMLEMRVLDLNELVQNLQKMLARLIDEDIVLQAQFAPDLPMIRADKSQIEQVVLNLVVNACDAMPTGGRLIIETLPVELSTQYVAAYTTDQPPGPYILIAVSDTGHGMDFATRKLIFEPFFTTKPVGQGTGLGLATVFGIVKQHQGFVWMHSEPDRGAVFKIYLPQIAPSSADRTPMNSADHAAEGPTLLVVEPEPMAHQVLTETLVAHGYQVLQATSAAEAIQRAAAHPGPIRLLLTPADLPDLSGPSLYNQLRHEHLDLNVLYFADNHDAAHPNHAPPDQRRLVRPFSITDLVHAVRDALTAS